MRKIMALAFALLLLPVCALADPPEEDLAAAEGWVWLTWLDGGITWLAPEDTVLPEVGEIEASLDVVMIAQNADYLLQVRRYAPNEMTFELYCAILTEEETTSVDVQVNGYTTVAYYRNWDANADSELCGVILTGLDGSLYKLSLFTGESQDLTEGGVIWQIAQLLKDTATNMELTTWLNEREVS